MFIPCVSISDIEIFWNNWKRVSLKNLIWQHLLLLVRTDKIHNFPDKNSNLDGILGLYWYKFHYSLVSVCTQNLLGKLTKLFGASTSFQGTIIVKLLLSYIYRSIFLKNELGRILVIKTVILIVFFLKSEFIMHGKWLLLLMIYFGPPLTESQIYNHTATVHHPKMTWHNTRWIAPAGIGSF